MEREKIEEALTQAAQERRCWDSGVALCNFLTKVVWEIYRHDKSLEDLSLSLNLAS